MHFALTKEKAPSVLVPIVRFFLRGYADIPAYSAVLTVGAIEACLGETWERFSVVLFMHVGDQRGTASVSTEEQHGSTHSSNFNQSLKATF